MTVKQEATLCFTLLCIAAALQCAARHIDVPAMPVSPFADTEVTTNLVINKADISYADVKFRFDGTPTNNLELAFGVDANTNGVLDAEETEIRYGWRSGRCFIENARTWEVFESEATAGQQRLSVDMHIEVGWQQQTVKDIDVAGANATAFDALVSERPLNWMWRREWNMMRVTRRGSEVPSDWISYAASNYAFSIILR